MRAHPPLAPRCVPLTAAHIPRLAELFERAVRQLGPAHYSPEQVEQWARGAHHPGFADQLQTHYGWVLAQGDALLGFITLSPSGHLGLLYVAPEWGRQGLASLLIRRLIAEARALGLTWIDTEASLLSYPLFLRHGFVLDGLEQVSRGGVGFTRHRLHLSLDDGPCQADDNH
ncbi:GNAT family N-acetyltransferase [Aeromonas crassostreae]